MRGYLSPAFTLTHRIVHPDCLEVAAAEARLAGDVLHNRHGTLTDERDRYRMGAYAVARDAAGGLEGVEAARERVGGARVEEDRDDLDALLERAARLMVKAGYSAYSVKIKVAGKEKRYGLMESSVFMRIVMAKRGTPPTGPGPKAQ